LAKALAAKPWLDLGRFERRQRQRCKRLLPRSQLPHSQILQKKAELRCLQWSDELSKRSEG
jgi:hypothetical protein